MRSLGFIMVRVTDAGSDGVSQPMAQIGAASPQDPDEASPSSAPKGKPIMQLLSRAFLRLALLT